MINSNRRLLLIWRYCSVKLGFRVLILSADWLRRRNELLLRSLRAPRARWIDTDSLPQLIRWINEYFSIDLNRRLMPLLLQIITSTEERQMLAYAFGLFVCMQDSSKSCKRISTKKFLERRRKTFVMIRILFMALVINELKMPLQRSNTLLPQPPVFNLWQLTTPD